MTKPSKLALTTNQPRSAAVLLVLTIADTTWRAFVPTIGGTLLGIGLDFIFNVAPWFTIIMIAVGCATSAWLIALQLRGVRTTR